MNRLFVAVMYPTEDLLAKAISFLRKKYGPIQKTSPSFDFSFTTYYEKEFGKGLKKIFLLFEKEIAKKDMVVIREKTGEMEETLALSGKRTVNIDPGYLPKSELVLATKKHRSFKEDLGDGVYAHKVLEFEGDQIKVFPHTFADYKEKKKLVEDLRSAFN